MTREEIIKKYKEFCLETKEGDSLTQDMFFELGIMHRQLPFSERSWSWLVDLTGWRASGESYRSFVGNRMRKEGILPTTIEKKLGIGEPIPITADDSETTSEYDIKMHSLFIARQKLRDERTTFNKTLRDEARIDVFKEFIKEVASTYSALPECHFTEKSDVKSDRKIEAVFGLADLHLGLEFENSFNSYNYEVAKQRIEKLTEEIIKYCNDFKVQRLHIINLGDLISGIIHPTLRLDQEYDVIEQVMRASEIVAEFVNKLQVACPEITYRSVVDNHARITPDKHQHIEKENMNRIIDWFVQERLKATNVMFCNDNIDVGIGRITLLNGKKLIFSHGHEDKKNSVVQDMAGLTKEFPDYILMAHYHNSAEHTYQGAKLFITGSIIGTDPFAYSHRLFGDPEQKLLIFDENNIIDININLR